MSLSLENRSKKDKTRTTARYDELLGSETAVRFPLHFRDVRACPQQPQKCLVSDLLSPRSIFQSEV